MNPSQNHDHADHLLCEQENLQWKADRLKSLAMWRRVEARLYAHEAETAAQRAEISHDEAAPVQRSGQAAAEDAVHKAIAHQHTEAGRNHLRLANAIQALGDLL